MHSRFCSSCLISGLKCQSYTKQDYISSVTVIKHAAESFSTNRGSFPPCSWLIEEAPLQELPAIMCLCHINLNLKALAAFQPVVTRVIAFHQISCPFPAVSHQQQPPPPNFHLCFEWVTPELHHVLLALQTHAHTHTRMPLLTHELMLSVKQAVPPAVC